MLQYIQFSGNPENLFRTINVLWKFIEMEVGMYLKFEELFF